MMEFPIDTGTGDLPVRRTSYLNPLGDVGSGKSTASTKSSAKRDDDGGIILNFNKQGQHYLKLANDVDELEQERLLALMDNRHMTWRHRWFSILEGRPHEFDEMLALAFNITSFSVVIISCIVFAIASVPDIAGGASQVINVEDPLFWIEAICILYFIIEAGLRVFCVPLNMLFDTLFIVDLTTIVGFFTDFFAGSSVSFLRVLRLLRVFRVMKISRYSRTLQLVFKVFRQSASGLSVLLMPIFLVVVTSSTVLYFVEISYATWDPARERHMIEGRPLMFQSIFDGIWFTMATITTIGYGDTVPYSTVGKVIAGLLALFGVLTLSFPNLVLGANLESAFALHKKSAARIFLSKRFRKVFFMVAFLRRTRIQVETRKLRDDQQRLHDALNFDESKDDVSPKTRKQRKEERAARLKKLAEEQFGYSTLPRHHRLFPDHDEEPNDAALGAVTVDRNRPLFFEHSTQQCGSLVQALGSERPDSIKDDNVRDWNYKGIKVREFLQVLFEGWSGVATIQEIYELFPNKEHLNTRATQLDAARDKIKKRKMSMRKLKKGKKAAVAAAAAAGADGEEGGKEEKADDEEEDDEEGDEKEKTANNNNDKKDSNNKKKKKKKEGANEEEEEEEDDEDSEGKLDLYGDDDDDDDDESPKNGSGGKDPNNKKGEENDVEKLVPENVSEAITIQDIAVAGLYLGEGDYIKCFALRRSSTQYVVSLTYKAVLELWLQKENASFECRRSAEYARFIYKQTTGKVTTFAHSSLANHYQSWAAREKYAGMGTLDSSPDLKLHIGITPAEIIELRRILALRTSDLSSVIPDVDRFEEQALERYHQHQKHLDKEKSNGGKNKNSATSASSSPSGGESPGGGKYSTKVQGAHHTFIGDERKPEEAAKLTMKLLLLHQRDLAAKWKVELDEPMMISIAPSPSNNNNNNNKAPNNKFGSPSSGGDTMAFTY